jgi:hypothetical protein
MNTRLRTPPVSALYGDWQSALLDHPFTGAGSAARSVEASEPDLLRLLDRAKAERQRQAFEIDCAARWQGFLNDVRRQAPRSEKAADEVEFAVRSALGGVRPVAALTEDDQVFLTWLDHEFIHIEVELSDDALGIWFCKDRRSGEYDGGSWVDPSAAVQAITAWLRNRPDAH